MPELVFTRRFSMGHRLIHGASESCALPHGHNELVTVRLNATTPARLDGLGNMAISFQQAKGTWHRFVDEKLDHALQLAQDDPLLDWFLVHEPARAQRIVVTPGDPTTELMACLLMAKINAFLRHEGGILRCTELSLQETPTNTVCFAGNPEDFIPQTTFSRTPWWQRADMSISDLS
ncbi:6-carboxytetrahydropterin synthase [Acetobacter suratthaniensis]|uniref:6-carboxy-5,6,7,8-tetrahydropterin synthase n=1 Tax=Acetobacter suratthaniensis TaxID=1502841 RepID=A0ABS3LIJ3_9PROT|nr:6-carboxytetrahydropterin synthase [Acetobacter suratthaniensis]MBO1327429.1 6-carboxytetrahydropterin synthase [Acetobacter suratthaniensis]MCX2564958.1 6-carboxytetrahydropterin synthase [Acetobacter suratthaniensis]